MIVLFLGRGANDVMVLSLRGGFIAEAISPFWQGDCHARILILSKDAMTSAYFITELFS